MSHQHPGGRYPPPFHHHHQQQQHQTVSVSSFTRPSTNAAHSSEQPQRHHQQQQHPMSHRRISHGHQPSNNSYSVTAASNSSNNPYRFQVPKYVYGFEHLELKASAGCTCRKSKCLKLYCQCFCSSQTCGDTCKCSDCHNQPERAQQIETARGMILKRNPKAFTSTPRYLQTSSCNCRKSHCLKKYCECYNSSLKCGVNCTCWECKNRPNDDESGGSPMRRQSKSVDRRAQLSSPGKRDLPPSPPTRGPAPAPAVPVYRGRPPYRLPVVPHGGYPPMPVYRHAQQQQQARYPVRMDTSSVPSQPRTVQPSRSGDASAFQQHPPPTQPPRPAAPVLSGTVVVQHPARHFRHVEPPRPSAPRPQENKAAATTKVTAVTTPPQAVQQRQVLRNVQQDDPKTYMAALAMTELKNNLPSFLELPSLAHNVVTVASSTSFETTESRNPSPVFAVSLPRQFTFRTICSTCGRSRSEHKQQQGFGSQCPYTTCGKCGCHRSVHDAHDVPMGVACCLGSAQGGSISSITKYNRQLQSQWSSRHDDLSVSSPPEAAMRCCEI